MQPIMRMLVIPHCLLHSHRHQRLIMTLSPVDSHSSSLVKQHNALTTARYNYSELQMDFLLFLLSKLRSTTDDLEYDLHMADLSKLTGKRYNYKYLQQATEEMGSRMFGVKTKDSYDQLWLFQKVSYLDNQATIRVKLAQDMLPYLFDLKRNYTTFELQAALKLTSKYAKRVYQICSQWKDKPETPVYPVLEFKYMLGVADPKTGKEDYKLFGDFKSKALMVALDQINAHTDLKVELVTHKQGRAVTGISFRIKMQSYALSIDFNPDYQLEPPAPDGITFQQMEVAERFLEEIRIVDPRLRQQILSSADYLKKMFTFAHDLKVGKVKVNNPGGYLLTLLGIMEAKNAPRHNAGTRPARKK